METGPSWGGRRRDPLGEDGDGTLLGRTETRRDPLGEDGDGTLLGRMETGPSRGGWRRDPLGEDGDGTLLGMAHGEVEARRRPRKCFPLSVMFVVIN
ncbi:Alkanesulfonate monooxygenase [Dissostichus eleginoides]|uniref:Alkanesulfonate monooxygenase n=1 Tax=Dissostichus eleginoides TaxID=100907 RepID=A0AAD9CIC0_DISEL|nr:Alkanesulfonate monooxygenase [Dissostichus eleginoides]